MSTQAPLTQEQVAARRASARRTALVFASIAFAVYVGFIVLNAVAK
ncbi:hypothetical protein [Lysobacter brunescens]|uniref:Uncharacterized protein n=1 Tax=Lysobacter brunescens TaxID=262323 RepID=A0ABW2YBU4_9GAMM